MTELRKVLNLLHLRDDLGLDLAAKCINAQVYPFQMI